MHRKPDLSLELQRYRRKREFNAKWTFKVTYGILESVEEEDDDDEEEGLFPLEEKYET